MCCKLCLKALPFKATEFEPALQNRFSSAGPDLQSFVSKVTPPLKCILNSKNENAIECLIMLSNTANLDFSPLSSRQLTVKSHEGCPPGLHHGPPESPGFERCGAYSPTPSPTQVPWERSAAHGHVAVPDVTRIPCDGITSQLASTGFNGFLGFFL